METLALGCLRHRTAHARIAAASVYRYRSFSASAFHLSTSPKPRVAVLYQELDPPLINGVRKPKKPGGYQDSGADIAYVLKHSCGIDVITPSASPDPLRNEDWCFGDAEESILNAVRKQATHLWANTILFANHPLQTSSRLTAVSKAVKVIGQPPKLVELFDDKNLVNNMLRARPDLTLPAAQVIRDAASLETVLLEALRYPVVAKPVRGRGSYGVKVCRTPKQLHAHCCDLLSQQASIIVEDYLAGQEATITVMPPSPKTGHGDYWAMPVVERFNHADGIAPYNGIVAVTQNSRLVSENEHRADPNYSEVQRQCVEAAILLQCTAPIRIDVRRLGGDKASPFALFDVNMKPNMTGPGRKGRENQASLTAIAAAGIGWDYPTLLSNILESSSTLFNIRNVAIPEETRTYTRT